jgi:hypothetical protein
MPLLSTLFSVEARMLVCILDRFGNVSRSYEPGRVEGLPQVA